MVPIFKIQIYMSMAFSKCKENSLQRIKKKPLVTTVKMTFIYKGLFKYSICRKSERLNFKGNYLLTRSSVKS